MGSGSGWSWPCPQGDSKLERLRFAISWSQGLARKYWSWPLNAGNHGAGLALSIPFQKIPRMNRDLKSFEVRRNTDKRHQFPAHEACFRLGGRAQPQRDTPGGPFPAASLSQLPLTLPQRLKQTYSYSRKEGGQLFRSLLCLWWSR